MIASALSECKAFRPNFPSILGRTEQIMPSSAMAAAASTRASNTNIVIDSSAHTCRRSFVTGSFMTTIGTTALIFDRPSAVIAADEKLAPLLGQIKEAKEQIEIIPDLINSEKWDAGEYRVNAAAHVSFL
jgi:hypothetical protein